MEGAADANIGLDALPPDVLAKVLQHLSSEDVNHVQRCSTSLHRAVQDERVWFALCEAAWAPRTDIRQWLPQQTGTPPRRAHLRPPATYRELFHMLRAVEGLCGLWRVVGEGPAGALVSFAWTPNSLEGEELRYHDLHEPPDRLPAHRFCPERGLTTAVEWGDGQAVTLKEYRTGAGGGRHGMRRSDSADSAAEVGLGGSPQSSSALGSSPPGSFEQAWLQFMHSSVAKPSKTRRRSLRGSAPAGHGPSATLRHLRRVDRPCPTAKHPLAGLWAGDYGPGGVQVVRLAYDFSGRAARIVAEKVTGDAGVAAGQRSFTAAAAASPRPWPPADEARVLTWQADQAAREEELAEALGGLGALMFEGDGFAGGDLDEGLDMEMEGVAPHPSAVEGRRAARRQVVGIHDGSGQVAGADSQRWVEGRLWVHADGSLSFYWLDGDMSLVALRRIDDDVPA